MKATTELTSGDLAKANGISRRTAYRWLKELHERYGPTVVAKRGTRYITTEAALATVAPTLAKTASILEGRLRLLEKWQLEQDQRMDGQANDLFEMKRTMERATGVSFVRNQKS